MIKESNNSLMRVFKKKYDVYCDQCNTFDSEVEYTKATGLKFSQLVRMLCINCFNKGIKNYRAEDYGSRQPGFCQICTKTCYSNANEIKIQTINQSTRFVCSNCVYKRGHPDNIHMFKPLEEGWDYCGFDCGTIRQKMSSRFQYWSTEVCGETTLTPECNKNNWKSVDNCSHTYKLIADFTKNKDHIKRIMDSDVDQLNQHLSVPGHRELFPITKEDLSYIRYGYTLHWCSKCGHFQKKLSD